MYLLIAGALFMAANPLIGSNVIAYPIIGGMLMILYHYARDRYLTSAGAFTFMYLLFFLIRPLYITLEGDLYLFRKLFRISPEVPDIHAAWWWSAVGLWCFAIGATVARAKFFPRRVDFRSSRTGDHPLVSTGFTRFLIFAQALSIVVLHWLTGGGRAYTANWGAYVYDFPMLMQAGHIFTVVVIWERVLVNRRDMNWRLAMGVSGLLFLAYTFEMRHVSDFRGFWLTGIMVAGIAGLSRLYGRVRYRYLVLPVIILLPIFRFLGEVRGARNDYVKDRLSEEAWDLTSPDSYWRFFDSNGDMNIFDTYVAAINYEPRHHPYLLSWLYVPVHMVPRKLWEDKPEKGLLVDHAFDRGAPYSPGIIGYFYLDGGKLWMLGSMFALGAAVTYADSRVLKLRDSYFKYCCYAILVINAMYLTRFILYQYFWQSLYMIVPCYVAQRVINGGRSLKTMARIAREREAESLAAEPQALAPSQPTASTASTQPTAHQKPPQKPTLKPTTR